jgi:hypothetical protein
MCHHGQGPFLVLIRCGGCGVVWCVWCVWWCVGVWGCVGGVVGVVGGCGGCGGVGVVSPCVRTFQGLHSVRLWTPTIFLDLNKWEFTQL